LYLYNVFHTSRVDGKPVRRPTNVHRIAMTSDRRIQKTRRALRNAMLELIDEQPYDAITVNDLVARADVARSSFYAHFRDKDDLLLNGFQQIAITGAELFVPGVPGSRFPDFALRLFHGIDSHRKFSQLCLDPGPGNVAYDYLRDLLIEQMRGCLAQRIVPDEVEPATHFLVSAMLGLLTWWAHNDFPCSATTLCETYNRLAVGGLQRAFN
jgi:AcrR family transcriptional regulator